MASPTIVDSHSTRLATRRLDDGSSKKLTVQLPGGKIGWYRAFAGGNKGCPVACTRDHGKNAVCEMHHKDK